MAIQQSLALVQQRQHIISTVTRWLVSNLSLRGKQSCKCGFNHLSWALSLPEEYHNLNLRSFLSPQQQWSSALRASSSANRTPAQLLHPTYSRILQFQKLCSCTRFLYIQTHKHYIYICIHTHTYNNPPPQHFIPQTYHYCADNLHATSTWQGSFTSANGKEYSPEDREY